MFNLRKRRNFVFMYAVSKNIVEDNMMPWKAKGYYKQTNWSN